MCGITGFWQNDGRPDANVAERMALQIRHRGPDDAGVWLDTGAGLALAHRRLAVIDISKAGHQPMTSPCGRFVLCYNGEIYNHLDLRADLEQLGGHFDWRGHSDTETLLAALRHWGVDETLQRINGMFAFALWDRIERKLFLARDRMGEKPLYYGRSGSAFLFASELKSMVVHPDWCREISREALTLYLRHNYVPTPWSIYADIFKLPPAHYIAISDNGTVVSPLRCYWDLAQVAEQGVREVAADPVELTDALDGLLRDAVGRRMAADVPLGAFLSGGYDSTMVVAQMQAQANQPVRTFSIGFHEEAHNEAHYAKAVATHLGTDHTELYVTPEQAMAVIPDLPSIWSEPFSDSSQIPTFLVSRLARQHVTVSLSGDGGDELFCGYNRYVLGFQIWRKLRVLPAGVRSVLSAILTRLPARQIQRIVQFLPQRLRFSNVADRLPKLAEVLGHARSDDFYRCLVSHWQTPAGLVIGGSEPKNSFGRDRSRLPDLADIRERMMYLDAVTYLPDDILTKVDRASMAVSLEARVPLLDHRVVEFAWKVPMALKYRNHQSKWLLRQVLYRYVSPQLVDRPKTGFGVPIEQWLRGPLREWAEELLDEKRLRGEGFFDPQPIRKVWDEHVSGKQRWHYYLWDILMFQSWLEQTQVGRSQRR